MGHLCLAPRPLRTWPARRNVFGYAPSPQSLKDPKSLYHGPSGTLGLDSIQSRKRLRSCRLILRSCMASTRWARIPTGRFDQVSICGIIQRTRTARTVFLLLCPLPAISNILRFCAAISAAGRIFDGDVLGVKPARSTEGWVSIASGQRASRARRGLVRSQRERLKEKLKLNDCRASQKRGSSTTKRAWLPAWVPITRYPRCPLPAASPA
jgi:hypothetical protein